ncbi:VC0807 family protein [Mycolicibacterium baixiangningiae]|uniref:VC0807 family protein n=2 Tax=Mycolicibacterium baixiangningiae TaxID=2761578 RepID=UPI0018E5B556|nr:VC0807 family protein [Mycolicibacterium baixiangningiae]
MSMTPDDKACDTVAATRSPGSSTPTVETGAGYRDLRRGLLSAAIGLSAYYGARGAGATPVDAMIISTLVCAGRAAYIGIRQRRFDAIACFLMFANAVTLAVAICARSPVAVMFGQKLPGVVFLAFVLGSLAMGKPMTEAFVKWIRPQWVPDHTTQAGRTAHEARAYHRTHMRLTTCIAAAQTLHLAAASIVILTLSVDVAQGLLSFLALATDLAVLLITVGGVSRYLMRRNSTVPG